MGGRKPHFVISRRGRTEPVMGENNEAPAARFCVRDRPTFRASRGPGWAGRPTETFRVAAGPRDLRPVAPRLGGHGRLTPG